MRKLVIIAAMLIGISTTAAAQNWHECTLPNIPLYKDANIELYAKCTGFGRIPNDTYSVEIINHRDTDVYFNLTLDYTCVGQVHHSQRGELYSMYENESKVLRLSCNGGYGMPDGPVSDIKVSVDCDSHCEAAARGQ
jgi:hypothetical protein